MNTILYGNMAVEILDDLGARVTRLSPHGTGRLVPRPSLPRPRVASPFLGRDVQVSDAYAAIRARRPIEFIAACGYGKSALLRNITAGAAYEGVAGPAVYLNAGADRPADLLQRLVTELYTSHPPVKPAAEHCGQLLSQARALVVLDDVMLGPGDVEDLLGMLAGCGLVIGSSRPVLGRNGTSRPLAGLPDEAAVRLLASELGRPLAGTELATAARLIAAVDGQPLHLRQAAALLREGHRSLADLAAIAESDPEELDRLSVSGLASHARRALAALALADGAMLPAALVGAMGDVAQAGEALAQLTRRGLAEQHADRFGLPACKVTGYRQLLLKDMQLASALRELAGWLANRNPTSADSLSAAGAALAIVEWAAERGDWQAVVLLARAAEPVLTLAGRWEASRNVLDHGLAAAKATGDRAAEALFAHEQGTLALCQDELGTARRLLERALQLREQLGDAGGADVTRHSLQLLLPQPASLPPQPASPPPGRPESPRSARKVILALISAVSGLVALTGLVTALVGRTSHNQVEGVSTTTTQANSSPTKTSGSSQLKVVSSSSDASETTSPTLKPPTVNPGKFGRVDITAGQPPATMAVTVTNPNDQPLTITGTQITNGTAFTKTADNCTAVAVPAGQTCTVTVQFAPTALGDTTGTLAISSAAPGGVVTSDLSGTGFVTIDIQVQGPGTVYCCAHAATIAAFQGSAPGQLSCQSAPVSADCRVQVTSAPVNLTASTAAPTSSGAGSLFKGWGGACQVANGLNCSIQPTADTQVTATFLLGPALAAVQADVLRSQVVQAGALREGHQRRQAGVRHEIRVIKRCARPGETMQQSHLTGALSS